MARSQTGRAWLILAAATCASASAETGSAACAACHAAIYKSYMQTPMAMSSGRVGAGGFQEKFERGEFSHALSGVSYRVYRDGNRPLFSFDFSWALIRIHGTRPLEYFIGSGTVGRSYLFSVDGFLYQAPVSYYSSESRWDMSPGYERYARLYLSRPVEAACLQCHASRLQPVRGTQNGFAAIPFLEGGIACELCHGPGEEHVRGGGIVNPAKLAPERRDSVCARCHLSGLARIAKRGRDPGSFQPGELLSDYLSVFVWSSASADMKVTSHVEKLEQSRCKAGSGDKLWCGSCHDPHSLPAEAEKVSYFRQKCVQCHRASSGCKERLALRARQGDNCVACHMPKSSVIDVEHAVYTDHSIPRRPRAMLRQVLTRERILAPFGKTAVSDRDLGLAYALAASSERNPASEQRAFNLLKAVETQQTDDVPALVQLAHLYDLRGDEDRAALLYERVLRADPGEIAAANNLGAILLKRGSVTKAIRLWSDVVARSPGSEAARMNLAMAQFRSGDLQAAQASLVKLLELNPGSTEARQLLNRVRTQRGG
jgi:cytochrome c-type biogenesis protein CcmH/NrfG